MLADMREAADHSEVVATVVAEVGVGALALPEAILRRTPRHLAIIVSDGYSSGPLGPICTSSCILFVTVIGSWCLIHAHYNV